MYKINWNKENMIFELTICVLLLYVVCTPIFCFLHLSSKVFNWLYFKSMIHSSKNGLKQFKTIKKTKKEKFPGCYISSPYDQDVAYQKGIDYLIFKGDL